MTVHAVEQIHSEGLLPYMAQPVSGLDVTTPYMERTSDRQLPYMVSVVFTKKAEAEAVVLS